MTIILWISLTELQTVLGTYHTISLLVSSEQWRHSNYYLFIQDAHTTINLKCLQSSTMHYQIIDCIIDFWDCGLKRTSRTFSITCDHTATSKHFETTSLNRGRKNSHIITLSTRGLTLAAFFSTISPLYKLSTKRRVYLSGETSYYDWFVRVIKKC